VGWGTGAGPSGHAHVSDFARDDLITSDGETSRRTDVPFGGIRPEPIG
jgi:hypothetical protein